MARHLDENTKREIYKLLLDEMPRKRICLRLGVTKTQVWGVAKQFGIKLPGSKEPKLSVLYDRLQGVKESRWELRKLKKAEGRG